MFGSIRLVMVGLLITGIAGAGVYVMKLRSDNAILKANQVKLEEAVSSQKELIANQKKDFQEILDANNKMNELVSVLKKDLDDLDKRFNKKNRDVGKLAIAKTKSIERITEADQLIEYKIKPNLRTLGKKYGKGLSKIKRILDESSPVMLVKELKEKNLIMLDNNKYQLEREDVFIETIATEGFSAASDAGITVGLSLDLTQDLILEGIVRDIVRIIQSMRKKAGFAVEDRINISWDFDGKAKEALGKFEHYFKTETLTNDIAENIHDFDYEEVVEINGNLYNIKLKKNK